MIFVSVAFSVEARFDHRFEDPNQRRPSELGQSVQADRRSEEGQGHRLLLRIAAAGQDPQTEVRRVRLRVQERKLLKKKFCNFYQGMTSNTGNRTSEKKKNKI